MAKYSPERFDALAEEIRSKSEAIMTAKRAEYSPEDVDRIQNFREVAAFMGVRPAQVAMTYLLKHMQSLNEAVRSGSYVWSWERPGGGEGLKQRIADAGNYLLLLAACIDEEAE